MKKKWFLGILATLVLALVLQAYWIGGLIMGSSSSDNISALEEVDYVIILGCGLETDKPGDTLQTRIDASVEFLNKYPDTIAVCTGCQGSDETISEAEAIEKALLDAGIPPKRIRKETKSTNTYENFQYAKEIILEESGTLEDVQVAIVTSEFHLYRSVEHAKMHGFKEPIKVSAKTPTLLFYPHFFREIVAVAAIDFRY